MFATYEQERGLWLYTCGQGNDFICIPMGSSYSVDLPPLPQLLCRPSPVTAVTL